MPSPVDLEIIGTPDDDSLCRVFGYQYQNDEPAPSVRVTVALDGLPQAYDDKLLSGGLEAVESDETGLWSIDLVRGEAYLLTIWASGVHNRSVIIPDQDVVNVISLLSI